MTFVVVERWLIVPTSFYENAQPMAFVISHYRRFKEGKVKTIKFNVIALLVFSAYKDCEFKRGTTVVQYYGNSIHLFFLYTLGAYDFDFYCAPCVSNIFIDVYPMNIWNRNLVIFYRAHIKLTVRAMQCVPDDVQFNFMHKSFPFVLLNKFDFIALVKGIFCSKRLNIVSVS